MYTDLALYIDGKLFYKTVEVPSPNDGTSPFQIGGASIDPVIASRPPPGSGSAP